MSNCMAVVTKNYHHDTAQDYFTKLYIKICMGWISASPDPWQRRLLLMFSSPCPLADLRSWAGTAWICGHTWSSFGRCSWACAVVRTCTPPQTLLKSCKGWRHWESAYKEWLELQKSRRGLCNKKCYCQQINGQKKIPTVSIIYTCVQPFSLYLYTWNEQREAWLVIYNILPCMWLLLNLSGEISFLCLTHQISEVVHLKRVSKCVSIFVVVVYVCLVGEPCDVPP